jgi:hypothetical protein
VRKKYPIYFMIVSLYAALSVSAETVTADAYSSAQQALEVVMATCYPEIDAESLIVPEISIDGVFSIMSIGLNGKTNAYVINPEYLACGGKSAGLCGTRGCDISIFAGEKKILYTGWQPEHILYGDSNLILLPQSGWACGMRSNASRCFSILSWDDMENKFVYHPGNPQ